MKFTIKHGEAMYDLDVDPVLIEQAEDFYKKMDADMDGGWKMGPEFVENLDVTQRAQVASQKLTSALDADNQPLLQMMIGYILSRLPNCYGVVLHDDGDPASNEILIRDN